MKMIIYYYGINLEKKTNKKTNLSKFYLTDLIVFMSIITIIYGLVFTTGNLFSTTPYSSLEIDISLKVLPLYAAKSLTCMITAYIISFLFSIS